MTESVGNIDDTSSLVRNALQNPASPYYLHPDDNPTLALVSPVLSGPNYHFWARAMNTALFSKNKFEFVDRSILVPSPTDPLFPAWQRSNAMVVTWITRSVSTTIAQSILWIDNAHGIWDDLKDRFSRGNVFSRIAELQEELYDIKQGDLPVSEYFSKLEIIWNELSNLRPIPFCECSYKCSCGAIDKMRTYQQQDYVLRFLRGLNHRYSAVRSRIMLLGTLPSVNKVFPLVLQQEQEMELLMNRANMNHHQNLSQNSCGNLANTKQCTYCGKPRHTVETCYGKHGFPPGFQVSKSE